jgi:hypothetical protein
MIKGRHALIRLSGPGRDEYRCPPRLSTGRSQSEFFVGELERGGHSKVLFSIARENLRITYLQLSTCHQERSGDTT